MSTDLVYVKWIAANLPCVGIRRTDERLYMSKRELLAMRDEINEFIAYYKDSFDSDNIDESVDNGPYYGWGVSEDGPNCTGES
jgi:hypothetical protein